MGAVLAVVAGLSATGARAGEVYALGVGRIEAPAGYVLVVGGTDSTMGRLTRRRDGFVIAFDIGGMAGRHVSPAMRQQCLSYREHTIDGRPAATCVRAAGADRHVETTIETGDAHGASPANFSADIRNDAALAEFERVVGGYRAGR